MYSPEKMKEVDRIWICVFKTEKCLYILNVKPIILNLVFDIHVEVYIFSNSPKPQSADKKLDI